LISRLEFASTEILVQQKPKRQHIYIFQLLGKMRRLDFMSEEIFDIVNERDEVVGQNTRREVHARGLWHRAVHVLVFNARGEVFLQKRSLKKDIAAGKWDSSASGHLDSGEDYDACAVRELREEIGLELECPLAETPPHPSLSPGGGEGGVPPGEGVQGLRRFFKIDACKETGWEFCWVYRCESEGPFVLHPDEIETGDWFAPDAVTKWVDEKPQDFASAFVLIWKKLLTAKTPSAPRGN
jgi:isopentenyldiphosphate isomerase